MIFRYWMKSPNDKWPNVTKLYNLKLPASAVKGVTRGEAIASLS